MRDLKPAWVILILVTMAMAILFSRGNSWADLANSYAWYESMVITSVDPVEVEPTGSVINLPNTPTTKRISILNHDESCHWFVNINGVDAEANGQHSVRIRAQGSWNVVGAMTDQVSVIDDGSCSEWLQVIRYY